MKAAEAAMSAHDSGPEGRMALRKGLKHFSEALEACHNQSVKESYEVAGSSLIEVVAPLLERLNVALGEALQVEKTSIVEVADPSPKIGSIQDQAENEH